MPVNIPLDPNMFSGVTTRNPVGILAMAMAARKRIAGQQNNDNSLVAGSNNAGGIMPDPTNAPSVGRNAYRGTSFGGYGGANNSLGDGVFLGNGGPWMSNIGGMGSNVTAQSPFNNQPASFAAGGMMSPQGVAIRPGAGMQPEVQLGAATPQQVGGAQVDQEAQKFVQSRPEEVQKIQQVISLAIESGELTPQELNMMVQLAKAALANPASYGQVRQFAIQNGLGTEAEIPPQMDEGLLYVLLVAGQAMQSGAPQGGGAGNAMTGQAPAPTGVVPEYKEGGMTGDRPHMAKLHPREYVVPEDALIYHGKKHFDKLVEQARTPPDAKSN